MNSLTDLELLERAQNGERAAFELLQGKLQPTMRSFTRRLIGRDASEDEIVQDAFYALFRNIMKINDVEHLRLFLYRVVRQRSYDLLRRKGRYPSISWDATLDNDTNSLRIPAHLSPEDIVIHGLLYAELQKVLNQLPEMQRQALILFGQEDLSYEQIATVLGIDVGTVKSRIFYGRQRLKKLLNPDILQTFGISKEETK